MVKSEGSLVEGLPGGNLSHSGAPVDQVLAELDHREARANKRRPGAWKKPPLKVYQDNFGFAVNSYQPMIDYINKKDCGENPEKDVHLPLLEERCMREYQSKRPVHGYSNSDIDFFIDKGEKIRTNIRQNDACGVSNVINRTHTNWSMTRKWVQLVKNSSVSDYRKRRGGEFEREPSVPKSILVRTPQKSAEFENIPRKIPQGENFRETTPRPNYVDDSSVDFSRALKELGTMESEKALQERKAKLDALDARFEESVNKMCNYVNKLTAERSPVTAMVNDKIDSVDFLRRNQTRRQMELANLEDSVHELTHSNSERNQRRSALQSLDERITQANRNINEIGLISDEEFKQAMHDIRQNRLNSRARSQYEYEHDDTNYLTVEDLGLGAKVIEENKPVEKKKPATPKGPVITDTYANVVARASDMACLTSEMRKISNRSRFVNCYRPQIKTGDPNAIVQPSKLEQNIDHMANTLAMDGKMRRRFDVDDEIEEPKSNLNSQMKEKYAEDKIHKPVVFPPSNSMKLRKADLRAQSRITLLGY